MYRSLGVDTSDQGWLGTVDDVLVARQGSDAMVIVAEDPDGAERLASIGAGSIAARLPGPGNPRALVGYIQWVSTDPTHRRKGLALQITRALIAWFRQRQVSLIELHATPEAEPLYRSLGFEDLQNRALRLRR